MFDRPTRALAITAAALAAAILAQAARVTWPETPGLLWDALSLTAGAVLLAANLEPRKPAD